MKKTYLLILAVITVIAVFFGCAYHMYGFGNKTKSNEKVEVSYDFEDIEKIDVEVGLTDMTITTGDKFSASFSGLKDLLPEFKSDNKTLTVYQKKEEKSFTVLKPNIRNLHDIKNTLTITVPEGTTLEEIGFDCGMGDLDVLGVSAKKMNLNCAMGSIKIENLTVDQLDLEADMGNASIMNVDVKNIGAVLAMGDFEADLVNDISEYGIEIEVSMGKCKVDGETVSNKYSRTGSYGTINVSSAMGDVNIK